jgi:5-methylcytosine-specific restriction endonuclease McrA
MREMNVRFERKSLLGRVFESEQEKFLRSQYEGATSHVEELRYKLSKGRSVDEFWSFLDIERYFIEKFSNELEEERKPLSEIGIEPNLNDNSASFGFSEEVAAAIVNGKLDSSCLNLKISYTQKYSLFVHDKITVKEYFENKFKKIKKRKEERNLRALAAEKTDKQRSLASSNRTKKGYENQLSIVSCCPYCGGNLGTYSGLGAAHFEHIHPVSKGGLSTNENTVFICADCNANKSNLTLNAFISKFTFDRDAVFERLSLLGKDF